MLSPGTPDSAAEGISGIEAERSGESSASALIVPARTCGNATAPCTSRRSTCPEIRSMAILALPVFPAKVLYFQYKPCYFLTCRLSGLVSLGSGQLASQGLTRDNQGWGFP